MRGLRPINWMYAMAFADRSVDMLAASPAGGIAAFLTFDTSGRLLAPPPKDVQPRILLPAHTSVGAEFAPVPRGIGDFYRRLGFEVRYLKDGPDVNATIIDGDEAFLSVVTRGPGASVEWKFSPGVVDDKAYVGRLQDYFDTLWKRAEVVDFHSTIVSQFSPDELTQAVVASRDEWDHVVESLLEDPGSVFQMRPRRFEELVAELLVSRGFDVELTPESRDGGRDILASSQSDLGRLLHLVECKRYAPDRPVGVSLVTNLYGVVEIERATNGIIVTTSRFTKGAIERAGELEYRIALRDYDALKQWLQDYRARSR